MNEIRSEIAKIDTSRDRLRDFGFLFGVALPIFSVAGWMIRHQFSSGHFFVILTALVLIIVLNLLPIKVRGPLAFLIPAAAGLSALRLEGLSVVYPAIGLVLSVIGLYLPNILTFLYRGWMILAICLGFVVSRIILTALYYFVMTPIGLIARLFGKKFLDLGFRSDQSSYWIEKKSDGRSVSRYESQF